MHRQPLNSLFLASLLNTELENARKNTCMEFGEELFLEVKELAAGTQAISADAMDGYRHRIRGREGRNFHNIKEFRSAVNDMFNSQQSILNEISGKVWKFVEESMKGQKAVVVSNRARGDLTQEITICRRLLVDRIQNAAEEETRREASEWLTKLVDNGQSFLPTDTDPEERALLWLSLANALETSNNSTKSLLAYNMALDAFKSKKPRSSRCNLQVYASRCLRRHGPVSSAVIKNYPISNPHKKLSFIIWKQMLQTKNRIARIHVTIQATKPRIPEKEIRDFFKEIEEEIDKESKKVEPKSAQERELMLIKVIDTKYQILFCPIPTP